MTMTDISKVMDVHKSTVSRQARAWGLVGEDGLVDLDAYRARRAGDLDPALQTTGRPAAAVSLPADDAPFIVADRARKMAADASLAELQLARQRASVLDRQAVMAAVEDYARQLRDRVLQVPREVASDCARLADDRAIEARLSMSLRAALDGVHAELTGPTDAVRGAA
jgi:hypothetical protein